MMILGRLDYALIALSLLSKTSSKGLTTRALGEFVVEHAKQLTFTKTDPRSTKLSFCYLPSIDIDIVVGRFGTALNQCLTGEVDRDGNNKNRE